MAASSIAARDSGVKSSAIDTFSPPRLAGIQAENLHFHAFGNCFSPLLPSDAGIV
jgi:hypothetical protein